MELNEPLKVCLLSLGYRYPDHVVDINEHVLGPQLYGAQGWVATDLIDMLQRTQPELLTAPAHMVIDLQRTEIYLLTASTEQCAFQIHCRGKMPDCLGSIAARQAAVMNNAFVG